MRQVPSKLAAQFQGIEHPIPGVKKIRTELLIAFDNRPEAATAKMRQRRSPRSGSEANQMFQTFSAAWIVVQPGSDDQHPGRMHDSVKFLIAAPVQSIGCSRKALRDVRNRDFII